MQTGLSRIPQKTYNQNCLLRKQFGDLCTFLIIGYFNYYISEFNTVEKCSTNVVFQLALTLKIITILYINLLVSFFLNVFKLKQTCAFSVFCLILLSNIKRETKIAIEYVCGKRANRLK